MKSLQRRIKRGKARLIKSDFVKNEDGTDKVILKRKTTKGRWI